MKVSDSGAATPAPVDIAGQRSGAQGSGSSSAANAAKQGEPIDIAAAEERHGDESPSIVAAIKAVGDKREEMARYLEDIETVIDTVPDPTVRQRLTQRLDTCRQKLGCTASCWTPTSVPTTP